jgi:hypothetical protein
MAPPAATQHANITHRNHDRYHYPRILATAAIRHDAGPKKNSYIAQILDTDKFTHFPNFRENPWTNQ